MLAVKQITKMLGTYIKIKKIADYEIKYLVYLHNKESGQC